MKDLILLKDDDVFPFGKYRGQNVRSIIDSDVSYCYWFWETMDKYSFVSWEEVQDKGYAVRSAQRERKRNARKSYNYTSHRDNMAADYWQDIHGHGPH